MTKVFPEIAIHEDKFKREEYARATYHMALMKAEVDLAVALEKAQSIYDHAMADLRRQQAIQHQRAHEGIKVTS